MTILYDYKDSLYINMTNKCPCACVFCIRDETDHVGNSDSLWLDHEPTVEEVKNEFEKFDLDKYDEIVFCGYGEPLVRINEVVKGKERTMRRAFAHALADFEAAQAAADYPLQVTVIDGNSPAQSEQWTAKLRELQPDLTVIQSHIGPTLGVHVGEGVMGLLWSRDWRKELEKK